MRRSKVAKPISPQANMNPLPKSKMLLHVAQNIQLIRLRELRFIVIGRGENDQDEVAPADTLSGKFEIHGGKTRV